VCNVCESGRAGCSHKYFYGMTQKIGGMCIHLLDNIIVIRGGCESSWGGGIYDVEVVLNRLTGKALSKRCNCPDNDRASSRGWCKHSLALTMRWAQEVAVSFIFLLAASDEAHHEQFVSHISTLGGV